MDSIVQALQFNLWAYFLQMPAVLARLIQHSALSRAAAATAILLFCLVTAYFWRMMQSPEIPTRRTCLWFIIVGFDVFGLGYGLFLPGIETNFSTAGLANRVSIASALGAAIVQVAILSLACSVLKSKVARARMFVLVLGIICGVNCLAVSGIAFFGQMLHRSNLRFSSRSLPM